jgi:hypothetical protein
VREKIEYHFRVPSAVVFTLYSYSRALAYRFGVPTSLTFYAFTCACMIGIACSRSEVRPPTVNSFHMFQVKSSSEAFTCQWLVLDFGPVGRALSRFRLGLLQKSPVKYFSRETIFQQTKKIEELKPF